jgi:putative endonuclease
MSKMNPQTSGRNTKTSDASREQCRSWYLYLLACADGTTYTGITTDPYRRVKQHNAGRGARYTALHKRRPVRLLGAWHYPDRGSATRAEARLKRRKAKWKRQLAVTCSPFEGAPFCHEYAANE